MSSRAHLWSRTHRGTFLLLAPRTMACASHGQHSCFVCACVCLRARELVSFPPLTISWRTWCTPVSPWCRSMAAQLNLGVCYDNGIGVAKDFEEAVKWYRQAADQGHADGTCVMLSMAGLRSCVWLVVVDIFRMVLVGIGKRWCGCQGCM